MTINYLQKIKQLMRQKEVSVETLSQLVKVKRNTLYNYINRKTKIPVDTLIEIAHQLGVSVCYFFENSESKGYYAGESEENYETDESKEILKEKIRQKDVEIDYLKKRIKDKDETISILKSFRKNNQKNFQ